MGPAKLDAIEHTYHLHDEPEFGAWNADGLPFKPEVLRMRLWRNQDQDRAYAQVEGPAILADGSTGRLRRRGRLDTQVGYGFWQKENPIPMPAELAPIWAMFLATIPGGAV